MMILRVMYNCEYSKVVKTSRVKWLFSHTIHKYQMTPSEALSRFRGSQKLDPLSWFMRISLGITRSRIKGHPIKMELRYSCFRDSARKKKLRYFCSTVDHSVLLLEVIFLRRVTLHCREFPRWENLKSLYSIYVNYFKKQ